MGDIIFVDFHGDNAELPIVIGTLTSRKEKKRLHYTKYKIKNLLMHFLINSKVNAIFKRKIISGKLKLLRTKSASNI
ncbi:hypothetical protein [Flavobacterium hibernum]|uniref:hypothetical protein n=1 Tax=Flavobacterium hibernum TaxID=37752 RepID=UPI001FAF078E